MASNRTLHLLASKMGLSDDVRVISKAEEFQRLLQTKTITGSNMTDTGKIVICLDLAAGLLEADLDLKSAIKYSGLKPTMYTNNKKMIQNLLELDGGKLTTSVLCTALQCSSVQALADSILEAYQREAKKDIDLNLPQYVCMAVYHACRISKVKVSKAKINERARLKPAQWAKLDADWAKFVDEHFAGEMKKRGRPKKISIEKEPEQMDMDQPEQNDPEPQIEPYDVWRRRILEAAYAQLKKGSPKESQVDTEMETEIETAVVRRSPRKTPQKLSVKTPVGGVKLLFPLL